MNINFEEIYAKDNKELTSLIQEWIDENINEITCEINNRELKYTHQN